MSPAPRVLVVGLDLYRVPGPWDPTPVAEAVATAMSRFAAEGLDAENCAIGLDGRDDIPTTVTAALRRGRWDVVVVGGGIRHGDERIEVFEQVVDLVRQHAPGAAIAFNRALDDIVEAARRGLARGGPVRGG